MSAIPNKLTLAPYLQRWDAATHKLYVHLLVMPIGNPLQPLGQGLGVPDAGPAFAASQLAFEVNLSKNWQQMPGLNLVDSKEVIRPVMPPNRSVLFAELERQFKITKVEEVMERKIEFTVRKHLMKSYTQSFGFVAPKTPLASTDDTYACLLKCPPKTATVPAVPDDSVSWAEAFSFALRQPILAKEMGFVYELEITLSPADLLKNGGWLFITLADSSDYYHLIGEDHFLKIWGTRVPALTTDRPLFTPVLFPVTDDPVTNPPPGNFDDAFLEAARYNDGFCKIVHGGQAKNRDHLNESDQGTAPLREEGIQLGWDDEDIVIAQNRQMGLEPATAALPAEAPLGVVGYRVDVRERGQTNWNTLNLVTTTSFKFANLDFGAYTWESRVEVAPASIENQFWLPSYFTRWKGGSLVALDDDDLLLLANRERPTPLYYQSVDADKTPLKYGNQYEFRTRMVDITNGGPQPTDVPQLPGESPIGTVHFKRNVPPATVNWLEVDLDPTNATVTTYNIIRPRINLPQALYTQYPNVKATLLAIQQNNRGLNPADVQDPSVPDPDTPTLAIRVLVRTPDFDPVALPRDNEGFVEWYQTQRSFPVDVTQAYPLNLSFQDAAQLTDIDLTVQLSDSPSGVLPLATARDIKIELRAVGNADYDYFANERARLGEISVIKIHQHAQHEIDFFLPQTPQDTIRSLYLQPTNLEQERQPTAKVLQNRSLPVLVQRIATAVGLKADDTTLLMPPGERGIFGCSNGLKHYLPGDNSSLVLLSPSEIPKQWINVLKWKINRDWFWKGFTAPTFQLRRITRHRLGEGLLSAPEEQIVGTVRMMHAVSPLINAEEPADRSTTSLIYIDAFQPTLGNDGQPYEIQVEYQLTVFLENGQTIEVDVTNQLPITTPPKQIPKVISAGIALSPYTIGENYASTGDRRRMLWLEFAEAIQDKRDTYFVRVLTRTADPMLLQHYQPLPEPAGYEQWSLNPELIRVVSPGQADDFAGLTAMQRLIPAEGSGRHFLVPLPPSTNPDSPELFGFYTYEIRVGHDKGSPANPFWSTAQGRFGFPVVLDGLQHPCPALRCDAFNVEHGILLSAAYAQPFAEGANIQANPPNTEIYFVIYAQVQQADGSTMRNIELTKRKGEVLNRKSIAAIREIAGIDLGSFNQETLTRQGVSNPLQSHHFLRRNEVKALLRAYSLPSDTPISILGIELLPEPTGTFSDPLGGNLGEVRLLRTSPLCAVRELCC